jgi:hypothetical protein
MLIGLLSRRVSFLFMRGDKIGGCIIANVSSGANPKPGEPLTVRPKYERRTYEDAQTMVRG